MHGIIVSALAVVGAGSAAVDEVQTALDHNKILCPVLAAMWKAGDLKADDEGNVELDDMLSGLQNGIGVTWSLAEFQAYGITDYDKDNKETEAVRDRCIPGATFSGFRCFVNKKRGVNDDSTKRWLNIFKMNGNQNVEHGISTGTRGGATNVPDPETCDGQFPCQERFNKFYVESADGQGRFYRKNLMKVVCAARKMGDRGGEFSYSSGKVTVLGLMNLTQVPTREWQMKAAISGMLAAFGRKDEKGEIYLSGDDVHALLMEGRYPDGYAKRDWGCIGSGCPSGTSLLSDANQEVECDVGESDEWWQGSGCKVETGSTCWLSCNASRESVCVLVALTD